MKSHPGDVPLNFPFIFVKSLMWDACGPKVLLIPTFLSICISNLSVATSSNGPLHVEYNIRSLMEHLYPGIEYTNTANGKLIISNLRLKGG